MRKFLKRFLRNKRAIILPGIIAIIWIILSSITWLAGAVIVSRTYDQLQGTIEECNPMVAVISNNALNAYGISIIVLDILFIVWWALSAQRVESQEVPYGDF